MPVMWRAIDPSLLKPEFYKDVNLLLTQSPYMWFVTEGFRSITRSDELYDEYIHGIWTVDAAGNKIRGPRGPRAAPGGKSAHNFGLAIDVALDIDGDKPGLQPGWNTKLPAWLWLKTACFKHPRLHNGNDFGDWPHIERYQWQRYK